MSIALTREGVSALTAAERGRACGRVAEAMATVIAARRAAFGACSADDLARDGFTAAEIIEYGPCAPRIEEAA